MNHALVAFAALLLAGPLNAHAQAPGVPIIEERHDSNRALIQAANALRSDGKLLAASKVRQQLRRKSCELELPHIHKQDLEGRELWRRARAAHIQIGYFYKCQKCTNWHVNLAGGYAITPDGAVATCYHVAEPGEDMKEGYLIGASADGKLLVVTEVLAASELADACIVRVQSDAMLDPLPLNPNASPGDDAWCYSDPAGREGYFSHGIVNRFFRHQHRDQPAPIRMNVSTDWAPGSSGAAVLDSSGNVISHVSEISSEGGSSKPDAAGEAGSAENPLIVFHTAVRAADVLALIEAP